MPKSAIADLGGRSATHLTSRNAGKDWVPALASPGRDDISVLKSARMRFLGDDKKGGDDDGIDQPASAKPSVSSSKRNECPEASRALMSAAGPGRPNRK